MKLAVAMIMLAVPVSALAEPLHDPIPEAFRGTFADNLAECRDPNHVEVVTIAADGVHYYEGDDYLLLGIAFEGVSTKSGKTVPLFNGRYTGRTETKLLGEVSARMELETPNTLIRYVLKDDGEVDPQPVNTWVRCPALSKR